MREELPALTTWQQIGLIMATPGYNDGAAFLDESDMADIARLFDEYKAECDAERDALRAEALMLEMVADAMREQAVALHEDLRECRDEMDAATTF